MAVIKCKMCGGDLVIEPGATVAECEYCGSRQTVPNQDNEKKLTLFARANRLRLACEFDKAAGVYESIVAEFPQEAEAYWGLVLCKYGIEYVDDPATGKKIPTCHRSSFESVLDDSNFDQALENADVVARKVYRAEAKQIEELRKGIIEVSAKEEPYDIFICYKETDDNGDRTLDSVLAQDIYDALTEKGYWVFFSRITLEDKLGQEYEPYIFAALNSAKILLAVGTDYEYYNAVWVKNEWSRYLMLMAKDRTKHLIPCYKNIDAYDMPKEFAKLQAQDMGKVGAMQDLLRGIEKILPKNSPATEIQEKIIVSGGGDSKITALLDRGNMALEDGDWDKADGFFEEVLNNDSKNAEAYLGKALAQEQCRNLEALVEKRLAVHEQVEPEILSIPRRTEYIDRMVKEYTIPGYVTEEDILEIFNFDRTYSSDVSGRQAQVLQEETWWAEHKLLSRAEKFATGSMAEQLRKGKKRLIAQLVNRVKEAQEADSQKVQKKERNYDEYILKADQRTQDLYDKNVSRRENYYQSWLEKAKDEKSPSILTELAKNFSELNDYKESQAMAEHCRKRAAEERAKIDTETARQKAIAEQKRKEATAKKKKLAVVIVVIIVVVVAAALLMTKVIIPGNAYKKAESLLASGEFEEASAAFEALGDYKDSQQRIEDCKTAEIEADYQAASKLVEEGRFEDAITAFENLGDYKDSKDRITEVKYLSAIALENAGNYDEAIAAFQELGNYKDSAKQIDAIMYTKAQNLCESGSISRAAIIFGHLGNYEDAKECSKMLWDSLVYQSTIATGMFHTVGLKTDGTVVAVGDNINGQCNVSAWKDIATIDAGSRHTIGLRNNGTVVAVGWNDYGQCDVSDWNDIVTISAGAHHTVGLKSDGTVVAVGDNYYGQCDVSDWKDIVVISAGDSHTVGMKSDGTIVAVGSNSNGECDIGDWKDVITVIADGGITFGLKSNGSIVAVGYNHYGQCNVSDWKNIVAAATGAWYSVGLKNDGTVVAIGDNGFGQCNVSNWKNIVAISAGNGHTVGLKANGTVVAVGQNSDGQCDVGGWKNIQIPNNTLK